MKWSRYFLPTLREDPKEAEVISHKLMLRAGLIRRLGSGAYSYLPFGLRALHKAIAIVREEMNRSGAQEVLLPTLIPMDLWKASGRDQTLRDVLIHFEDRTGKQLTLGPTHEEVITELVKELRSYKQLPITLYQIQNKFRDEPRPRGGIIRSKEFLMKDAYSFDVDEAGLDRSYQTMYEAYQRIFKRCGLNVLACEADPGAMGGDVSHEFMAPSENGEDRIVRCTKCGYASNLEAAKCQHTERFASDERPAASPLGERATSGFAARRASDEQRKDGTQHTEPIELPKPIQEVHTPGKHTVEQVSQFLKVSPTQLIKTLLYDVGKDHVAVLVRGDHEVNEAKLARLLRVPSLKLSSTQTIERLSGAPLGFSGPVGLKGVRLLADHSVMQLVNAVTGANKAEAHLVNVNPQRDFQVSTVEDLRVIDERDPCSRCGDSLEIIRAIEVAHVFKLGTKYSEALGACFQDTSRTLKPMIMGCYGIGINRILAALIEQSHDSKGIVWPATLAPFQVLISLLERDSPEHQQIGQDILQKLTEAGLDVLLDDREQSPGSKFKDAELIGFPVQIVIGKTWNQDRHLELVRRATQEKRLVSPDELIGTVQEWLGK